MNSFKNKFPVMLGILVGIYVLLFFLQQGALIILSAKVGAVSIPFIWLVLRITFNLLIITVIYLIYDNLKNNEDPKKSVEIQVIATILALLPILLFAFNTTRIIYSLISNEVFSSNLNPFVLFQFFIKLISIILLFIAFFNVLIKKGDKSITNLMLILFTILFVFNYIILSVILVSQSNSFSPLLSFTIYNIFKYISSVWLIFLFILSARSYVFLITSALIQGIFSVIGISLQVVQTFSRYRDFIGNEEIGEQFLSLTFTSFVLQTLSLISIFIFWGIIVYFLIKIYFKIKESKA